MKKINYFLIFIITFLFTLTVNANYKEYRAGDIIYINDEQYLVIENSNSSNSKLKVMPMYEVGVSNIQELETTCNYHSYGSDTTVDFAPSTPTTNVEDESYLNMIKCVSEHASFCTENESNCGSIMLPFETKSLDKQNGEELTYDETSETNIGYYIKNKLEPYYKNKMGLTNVSARLLTASEHINYAKSINMVYGGYMLVSYGELKNSCLNNGYSANKSIPNGSSDYYGGPLEGNYWINSLEYTKNCYIVVSGEWEQTVYADDYDKYHQVLPLLEVSKNEFEYMLTKETEGEGTLELSVSNENNRTYNVGDYVIVGDQDYVVINKNGNELQMISIYPVGISNYNELRNDCFGNLPTRETTEVIDFTENYQCAIRKAKYCKVNMWALYNGGKAFSFLGGYEEKISEKGVNELKEDLDIIDGYCYPFYMPYNYDDLTNRTYNPDKTNNAGHYVKNELTEELKKTFGNNITVDVLTYEEIGHLVDIGLITTSTPWGGGTVLANNITSSNLSVDANIANSPIYYMYENYINSIINVNSILNSLTNSNISTYPIYPVVTVTASELPLYSKSGNRVGIKATPSEGYELVELKVTSGDTNVTYSPSSLTHYGESNYSFTMPSNATHVYAKFVTKMNRYNAKSVTTALVVDEGLNRAAGEKVRFNINLSEDEYLEKIIYYDESSKEIEIEYQKVGDSYELTMPAEDIYIEAVIKSTSTLYGLFGEDVEIPVEKSKAGEVLTFKLKDPSKTIESIVFKNKEGKEISPYYAYLNGVYSVIMPEDDVYVELTYMSEMEIRVPKTGDTINKTFIVLVMSIIVTVGCGYVLVKNNKRKSFN